MKIVITDAGTVFDKFVSFDVFKKFGEVTSHHLLSYDELSENIKDADIVLCNKSIMDENVLKNARNLKYIGLFATGYNNIDIDYCKAHGITVCNAGSYSTGAVAQHTFALILAHYSKVPQYSQFVRDGGWVKSQTFSPFICSHNELFGKTIGIIGYGSIGENVAKIALAFGMKVLAFNRSKKSADAVEFVSLDELLSRSDIVSVHCPLNDQSKEMFDSTAFSKMKGDALFVNTARGGVVNEQDLYDALENDVIGGAAIDVLTVEPMEEKCILTSAKNCIITPHVAWAPVETRKRLIDIVSGNIDAYLKGESVNVVV